MSSAHANPIQFGNPSLVKEQVFDLWRFNLLENFWRDLAYAERGLRRSPMLLLCALVSVGFGTGANTAMFQLLDAVRCVLCRLRSRKSWRPSASSAATAEWVSIRESTRS